MAGFLCKTIKWTDDWKTALSHLLDVMDPDVQLLLSLGVIEAYSDFDPRDRMKQEDCSWLKDRLQGVRLGHLKLSVDFECMMSDEFLDLLSSLPTGVLRYVKLRISISPDQLLAVDKRLTDDIAPKIAYPLLPVLNELRCWGDNCWVLYGLTWDSKPFETQIIATIQAQRLLQTPQSRLAFISNREDYDDPLLPKIRLKSLIKAQKTDDDVFIPVEIQHTEEVESQQVEQQEAEEAVDVVEDSIAEQGVYQGRLIHYAEYLRHHAEYLRHRCRDCSFGNLPHAIKYLTPAAADRLSEYNLFTFNRSNPPLGFVERKTEKGELIWDYQIGDLRLGNVFTPTEHLLYDEKEDAYYDVAQNNLLRPPTDEQIKTWLKNDQIDMHKLTFSSSYIGCASSLTNLWIRYGNAGVERFLSLLTPTHVLSPAFMSTFIQHYIIPSFGQQLDLFMEHDRLAQCIARMNQYDEYQVELLSGLLRAGKDSVHDLIKTLDACDAFWQEVDVLCQNRLISSWIVLDSRPYEFEQLSVFLDKTGVLRCRGISLACLGLFNAPLNEQQFEALKPQLYRTLRREGVEISFWSRGTPVVLLERLLTILKNSSDIEEQIDCLRALDLGNMGEYYASQYEGFKCVHPDMKLKHYPNDWSLYAYDRLPSDLTYYKQAFILSNHQTELWYISDRAEKISVSFNFETFSEAVRNISLGESFNEGEKLVLHARFSISYPDPYPLLEYGIRYQLPAASFEPHKQLFRVNFSSLYSLALKDQVVDPDTFYLHLYRFLGQQAQGISYKKFRYEQADFLSFGSESVLRLRRVQRMHFASLFFITHARFDASRSIKPLLEDLLAIDDLSARDNRPAGVFLHLCESLYQLYNEDVRLNNVEGELICSMIKSEMENNPASVDETVTELLLALRKNKDALFKWIACRAKNDAPATHSMRIALMLAKALSDDAIVATALHDDLLVFSELISLQTKPMSAEQLKAVKTHLKSAAEAPHDNQYTAIQLLVHTARPVDCDRFLLMMEQIKAIDGVNIAKIKSILQYHGFSVTDFVAPPLKVSNQSELKHMMAQILVLAKRPGSQWLTMAPPSADEILAINEKINMHFVDLEKELQTCLAGMNFVVSGMVSPLLHQLFKSIRDNYLQTAFAGSLSDACVGELLRWPLFQSPTVGNQRPFTVLGKINEQAQHLSALFKRGAACFKQQEDTLLPLLKTKMNTLDYREIYHLMRVVSDFEADNQVELLKTLLTDSDTNQLDYFHDLLNVVSELRDRQIPPSYICAYIRLTGSSERDTLFHEDLLMQFRLNPNNDVLSWVFSKEFKGDIKQASLILRLTKTASNTTQLCALLKACASPLSLLSGLLNALDSAVQATAILSLLAKSYSTRLPNQAEMTQEEWQEMIHILVALDQDAFVALSHCYEKTTPNTRCLWNVLHRREAGDDVATLMNAIEREPFGLRDDQVHFDVSNVERVIHSTCDLSHHSTPYLYQTRKQLMESFLFVNDIGYRLPLFGYRTVKELNNEEIQSYFQMIKQKTFHAGLTDYQTQLCALALIREAMYRTTGQFPFSTQMIAVIDCLMHPSHVISNIDTGQGKSLIDMMRVSLLWLNSDRVDMSTSSIVDARRDLEHYSPFLSFLGVPFSKSPITASSKTGDFLREGVNVSTFAQLALFFSKMTAQNKTFEDKTDKVSFIVNESDYSLLDDRTIYRFATSVGMDRGAQSDWLYDAINEYVTADVIFTSGHTSKSKDIHRLKKHVLNYAKKYGCVKTAIQPLLQDQEYDNEWLAWIESAILVNYKLEEGRDYVIPFDAQRVKIRGKEVLSHVVKLLMSEADIKTKVSPDSKFGNGIQQLLYSKLNKTYRDQGMNFVIEPQTKTIISSNNKNLMDYYRKHGGLIWGSSGTVGSSAELNELYTKYGIPFSLIPPHQQKQVVDDVPQFFENEKAHFDGILSELMSFQIHSPQQPHLIFCKDIPTVRRLHEHMSQSGQFAGLQRYTGLEDERALIAKAALPGVITITTAAIGRNTDILYDKKIGMEVWHTRVNSMRIERQGSGRTGRQGSKGGVHFLFNREDMSGRDISTIQKEIDAFSSRERLYNETLYSILGYVLRSIEDVPEECFNPITKPEFFEGGWSTFSEKCERHYRQMHADGEYTLALFLDWVLFNLGAFLEKNLPDLEASNPALWSRLLSRDALLSEVEYFFTEKPSYNPYTIPVKLEDATSSVDLLYQLIGQAPSESTLTEDTRAAIKAHVNQLLHGVSKGDVVDQHVQYLRYLSSTPATLAEIRDIHQACLSDFLTSAAKIEPWYWRWLGYAFGLKQISNDGAYLVLFRALSSVPVVDNSLEKQSLVDVSLVKQMVHALLDDYRYRSWWFISSDRKADTAELIKQLESVENMNDLVALLSKTQIGLAEKDVASNQQRMISIHFWGSSRLQDTITRALNLATSLNGGPEQDSQEALLSGLGQHLEHALGASRESAHLLSLDEVKKQADELLTLNNGSVRDKSNAGVIVKTLEATFDRSRSGLFQPIKKDEAHTDEVKKEELERDHRKGTL